MKALLILLFVLQDPVDTLIERLGDTDPDVREKAQADLVKTGPAALEKLRGALKNTDPEIVMRAQQAIEQIERNQLVRKAVKEGTRVTVKVKDAPLSEVAKSLGEVTIPDEFKDRTVTLDLENAELLRALDEICRQLRDVSWRFEGRAIVFTKEAFVDYPAAYSGPFKFKVVSIRSTRTNDFTKRSADVELSVAIDMEGSKEIPAHALKIVEATDEGGTRLEWQEELSSGGPARSISTITMNGRTIRVFDDGGKVRVVVDEGPGLLGARTVTLREMKNPASKFGTLRGEALFTILTDSKKVVNFDRLKAGEVRSAGDLEVVIDEVTEKSVEMSLRMKGGGKPNPDLLDSNTLVVQAGGKEYDATLLDATDDEDLDARKILRRRVERMNPGGGTLHRFAIRVPREARGKELESLSLSIRESIQHRVEFEFKDVDLR